MKIGERSHRDLISRNAPTWFISSRVAGGIKPGRVEMGK